MTRSDHTDTLSSEFSWTTDAALAVVAVSDSFSTVSGCDPADVLGATWRDFLSRGGPAGTLGGAAFLSGLDDHRSIKSARCIIHDQNAKAHTFSMTAEPVVENGDFQGYRGVALNITAHVVIEKSLERSEWELRAILDNMQDTFFRVDRRGRFVLLSPSAETLLGESMGNLLAMRAMEFVTPGHARDDLKRAIRDGEGRLDGYVLTLRRADGEDFWCALNVHPYRDESGAIAGFEGTVRDVDETKRAENGLRSSERRYRRLVEMSPNGIVVHRDGVVLYANQQMATMTGADNGKALEGMSVYDLVPEEYQDAARDHLSLLDENWSVLPTLRTVLKGANGAERQIDVQTGITGYRGDTAAQSVVTDVTERVQAEDDLRLAATVFDTTSEAIVISDPHNRILTVNPAFTRITGYTAEEAIGQNPNLLSSGRHTKEFYETLWTTLQKDGHWHGEIWNRRKNGEVYPEWLSIAAVYDKAGALQHYVAVFSDITSIKRNEERIRYQANFDPLTDLPNRNLFMDRLWQALAVAKREKSEFALMFLDLDRFKLVNDTLGHAAGDALLIEAARRIRSVIREEDTVARLGGDEFTVILPNVEGSMGASVVAKKVLAALQTAFDIDGNEAHIGGSIGISLYPQDGVTADEILKNADAAMYQAKESGRNAYHFYTPEIQQQAFDRLTMENALRAALRHGEFELYYQPQVDVASGALCGAETLIRWNKPDTGLVSPADFVPVAEDTGLIVPIGEWVLREACRMMVEWDAKGVSLPRIAVNLSVRQFRDQDIPALLQEVCAEHALSPHRVELEITESLFAEDQKKLIEVLERLKDMGADLAIDDFGTGYSSLGYLRQFPVDVLKIDRSFINKADTDAEDAAIAEAIIAMAHSLNLKVVAEGVETHDQLAFLHRNNCDIAQGYLIAKPLPVGSFEEWVREHTQL